jgi:hypothetical protein
MQFPQSCICIQFPAWRFVRCIRIGILAASAAVLPLTVHAATQTLTFSPAQLRFGQVAVGQMETQLAVITNPGTSSMTISSTSISGSEFSLSGLKLPAVVAAGESVSVNISFTPTQTGWTGQHVTFTTKSSGNVELPVAGAGVNSEAMTAQPSSLSFGQVTVGSSSTQSVTVENDEIKSETLTAFQIAGSGFTVSGPSLPLTLASGKSVTLKVTFKPQESGVDGGSLMVSGPGAVIPLFGTGEAGGGGGQLSVTPSVSFGSVMLGSSASLPSKLTATGASVTISSATTSGTEFSLTGVSFPLTIKAGQSVSFDVEFSPETAGSASSTISFASNASNGGTAEAAAGTGAAPYVSLSWTPSTSKVTGYNVYRGTTVNDYTKINSALDANNTYTDSTVTPGTTYYYAATSVNSSGEESSYSSPITVQVP